MNIQYVYSICSTFLPTYCMCIIHVQLQFYIMNRACPLCWLSELSLQVLTFFWDFLHIECTHTLNTNATIFYCIYWIHSNNLPAGLQWLWVLGYPLETFPWMAPNSICWSNCYLLYLSFVAVIAHLSISTAITSSFLCSPLGLIIQLETGGIPALIGGSWLCSEGINMMIPRLRSDALVVDSWYRFSAVTFELSPCSWVCARIWDCISDAKDPEAKSQSYSVIWSTSW